MHAERRGAERFTPIINFSVEDPKSGKTLGHIGDLSSGGLMLLSSEPMPVGKTYDLRLRLDSELSRQKEIVMKAETRWCRQDINPDLYATGLMATNLDKATQRAMATAVQDLAFKNIEPPRPEQ